MTNYATKCDITDFPELLFMKLIQMVKREGVITFITNFFLTNLLLNYIGGQNEKKANSGARYNFSLA